MFSSSSSWRISISFRFFFIFARFAFILVFHSLFLRSFFTSIILVHLILNFVHYVLCLLLGYSLTSLFLGILELLRSQQLDEVSLAGICFFAFFASSSRLPISRCLSHSYSIFNLFTCCRFAHGRLSESIFGSITCCVRSSWLLAIAFLFFLLSEFVL